MPLINVFLWIMLLLAASTCYQLLHSYNQSEQTLRKCRVRSCRNYGQPAHNDKKLVGYHSTGRIRNPVTPARRPENIMTPKSVPAFFNIYMPAQDDQAMQTAVEYNIPGESKPGNVERCEKMAAVSDHHHCA